MKAPRFNPVEFVIVFLTPTLVGKGLILYFGTNYTEFGGKKYLYGLLGSIAFTLIMLARFLWRYRHYQD